MLNPKILTEKLEEQKRLKEEWLLNLFCENREEFINKIKYIKKAELIMFLKYVSTKEEWLLKSIINCL